MTITYEKPSIDTLNYLFENSGIMHIVSPFYSRGCLKKLRTIIEEKNVDNFSFWTRPLNLEYWNKGLAAPDTLLKLFKLVDKNNGIFDLMTANNLHAKMYIGDKRGAFGSSNLTVHGFSKGYELLAIVKATNLMKLKNFRINKIKPHMKELDIEEFEDYIEENEYLVTIKSQLEHIIEQNLVKEDGTLLINRTPSFWDYIHFIESIDDPEAEYIVNVVSRGKNNLIGHYRAFYFVSNLFFNKYPDLISKVFTLGSSFSISRSDYKNRWNTFMRSRSLKKIIDFSEYNYSPDNVRNYLPTYLSGKQTTGGAGAGNLNRSLYFVAAFRLFLEGKVYDL